MTKHKIQNKSKAQIPNVKTLSFGICHLKFEFILSFGFCHLSLTGGSK
jgi:hypothetical protein